MNILSQIRCVCDDALNAVRCYRRRLLICAVCLAAGIIVGCLIYAAVMGRWWYFNRCNYVVFIMETGSFFSVFFRCLLNAILVSAILLALSLKHSLCFFKYILAFAVGLYLAMYIRIAVDYYGLAGILCFIFVFLTDALIVCFAVFLSTACECGCGKVDFQEALCCNKQAIILLSVGIIVKTLLVFVFVRLLTALI